MIICLAEDRLSELDTIKLLIHSIHKHCDPIPLVHLVFPPADNSFKNWLTSYPEVELSTEAIIEASGWDIKPYVLTKLLNDGHQKVLWMDSDIIINANISQLIEGYGDDTLVISEEPKGEQFAGGTIRAENWGFEIGRSFKQSVNAGLILCTPKHIKLLDQWKVLIQSTDYRKAQALPWHQRPIHLLTDQDLLSALFNAKEWAHIPIEFLESGKTVVQESGPGGYSPTERLSNIGHDLPAFTHAMKKKPWRYETTPSLFRNPLRYYYALHCELSVYSYLAGKLAPEIGLESPWLTRRSIFGSLLKFFSMNNPSLAGLPLAIIDRLGKKTKRMLGIDNVMAGTTPNKKQ
jgi:hypothetical protein